MSPAEWLFPAEPPTTFIGFVASGYIPMATTIFIGGVVIAYLDDFDEVRRFGARLAICAPIWPLALVVTLTFFITRGTVRLVRWLWRTAEIGRRR